MEETQVSIIRRMNKENGILPVNGILFSLKKERNSAVCYNWINLEDIILSEISQLQKDKYCMILIIIGTQN